MFFDTCVLELLRLIGISTTKKRALCGLHAHIAISVLVIFSLILELCLLVLLIRSKFAYSQIFYYSVLGLLIVSDVLLLYGVSTRQPGYYDMFLYVKYASFFGFDCHCVRRNLASDSRESDPLEIYSSQFAIRWFSPSSLHWDVPTCLFLRGW
ncbi:hypothetical protein M3Y94_00076700 [Aphelenchoides besseyi]|nr:hypothetical protein M3Y94_00076700 [Aphelenchoides besseyi]